MRPRTSPQAALTPRANRLVAALEEETYTSLRPLLEAVAMPRGAVVYEAGRDPGYVYFPADCIVSLLYVLRDGASAEVAVIGREGAVGIALVMGGETTPSRAVAQYPGWAYRINAGTLKREFKSRIELQTLLLRITQALIAQVAQTAVCNRHHTLDQQLCRWLLFSVDRLPALELSVTHEWIATMLGVRREGVTAAAGRLQSDGVIRCRRGRISVSDRARLESRACECYAVVRREYDRLLPGFLAPGARLLNEQAAENG